MEQEQGLTVQEAALRLSIQAQTLYLWCNEGRIPAVKMGRVWRITERTVNDVLKGKLQISPPAEKPHKKPKESKKAKRRK